MNPTSRRLLIVGASARAAAFSTRRASLDPWAADCFADLDLGLACPRCCRVQRYPHDFLTVSQRGPAGPWLYTGAMENWPALVDEIASSRPLWGNSGRVLRQVRCPSTLFRVLRENGFPCPAVCEKVADVPAAGSWLIKPRDGAAGRGIDFLSHRSKPISPNHYAQEFIDGEPCSAVYVANNGTVQLLGVTRQLVGEAWLHARRFQYCGSIGPLLLSSTQQDAFLRLGQVLASSFGLQGLFGIDGVLRDGVLWPVEINPRFTASVEVLEWASGKSALASHARAFEPCSTQDMSRARITGTIGKAIYYAKDSFLFPKTGPWLTSLQGPWDAWQLPEFADIPRPGQRFEPGRPVLTFFARASTLAACLDLLRRIADDLDGQFRPI